MRRWVVVALVGIAGSFAVARPCPAALQLSDVNGHLAIGFTMLSASDTTDTPGGSLSIGGGADVPVTSRLRAGVDVGYHLLGSRTLEQGSLTSGLDYSVFEVLVLVHWTPTDRGPLLTISGGPGLFVAKAELAATLERLENDPTIKSIRITGIDDCLKASPKDHRILRKRRALKVKELLGPKARAKLTFVGGAPLATFIGPNTDRAARARNRSVLIEFVSEVSFADEPQAVTAQPCHEQLIRRALRQMRDDQSMDGKIKSRLGAALGNSLAGHDDSFIRPGSTSWMFPFHWSSIKQYFKLICGEPGGAAALSAAGLMRKLLELDQDIRNGVESLVREEQKFSSISNKKMVLATDFRRRLDALLKNKANSTYAEY